MCPAGHNSGFEPHSMMGEWAVYFQPSECVASLHTPLEEGKPEKHSLSVKREKKRGGGGLREREIEFSPVVGYSCGQH